MTLYATKNYSRVKCNDRQGTNRLKHAILSKHMKLMGKYFLNGNLNCIFTELGVK